jgi:hypothetical protein
MTAITVKRTILRRNSAQRSATRPSFRELSRSYLAGEKAFEFAIEALFFATIVATSAWPLFAAAGALHEFPPDCARLNSGEHARPCLQRLMPVA